MKIKKEIGKVIETNSYKYTNRFIELGWILMETCQRKFVDEVTGDAIEGDCYARYSLGWPKELGDEQYPNIPMNDLDGIDAPTVTQ